ncbi:MAG: alanyl-tRNA editing protein, partial [Spirochaetales bacterium]|nr:alanyl-tRNA editing protein [Spirochaetales bacterium]
MDKVFRRDPYRTTMNAIVSTVYDRRVTLRETIFFAFSGGQESDRGTIGGISVAEAETRGRDIVYTLEDAPHFGPGDTVEVKIDWDRRYRLMRLHFAAEIVLALTTRTIPTIERIGAHISETKSRIDFRLDQPISPWLVTFEKETNAIIDADRTIISAFS